MLFFTISFGNSNSSSIWGNGLLRAPSTLVNSIGRNFGGCVNIVEVVGELCSANKEFLIEFDEQGTRKNGFSCVFVGGRSKAFVIS